MVKSVLNYRSYPKNKTGYQFLDHPVSYFVTSAGMTLLIFDSCFLFWTSLHIWRRILDERHQYAMLIRVLGHVSKAMAVVVVHVALRCIASYWRV